MSPDGAYLCFTRTSSPTAVLLRKNSNDTYSDLAISQTDPFNFCDLSNQMALFGGPISLRVLKKQNYDAFVHFQTIAAIHSTTSLKISYFGNWLMVGNNNKELLIYSQSTSNGNYYIYETMAFSKYVSDVDMSYDSSRLLAVTLSTDYKIF